MSRTDNHCLKLFRQLHLDDSNARPESSFPNSTSSEILAAQLRRCFQHCGGTIAKFNNPVIIPGSLFIKMPGMPQEPLRIEDVASPEHDQYLVRLTGPIVINNLFEFQSKIRSNSARRLIIDMAAAPYVDSAGIGALVGAHITQQKNDRSLALVGVNDRVRAALQVTRVESFFRFFQTVPEAERATAA
jgi:anti-sigma B factor antagonist